MVKKIEQSPAMLAFLVNINPELKNTVEAKSWLDKETQGSATAKSTLYNCCAVLKLRKMSTEDEHVGMRRLLLTKTLQKIPR